MEEINERNRDIPKKIRSPRHMTSILIFVALFSIIVYSVFWHLQEQQRMVRFHVQEMRSTLSRQESLLQHINQTLIEVSPFLTRGIVPSQDSIRENFQQLAVRHQMQQTHVVVSPPEMIHQAHLPRGGQFSIQRSLVRISFFVLNDKNVWNFVKALRPQKAEPALGGIGSVEFLSLEKCQAPEGYVFLKGDCHIWWHTFSMPKNAS